MNPFIACHEGPLRTTGHFWLVLEPFSTISQIFVFRCPPCLECMAPYPIDVCQVIPCDRCSVFPAVESSSVTGELCNKRGSWVKNPVACYAYIHCSIGHNSAAIRTPGMATLSPVLDSLVPDGERTWRASLNVPFLRLRTHFDRIYFSSATPQLSLAGTNPPTHVDGCHSISGFHYGEDHHPSHGKLGPRFPPAYGRRHPPRFCPCPSTDRSST